MTWLFMSPYSTMSRVLVSFTAVSDVQLGFQLIFSLLKLQSASKLVVWLGCCVESVSLSFFTLNYLGNQGLSKRNWLTLLFASTCLHLPPHLIISASSVVLFLFYFHAGSYISILFAIVSDYVKTWACPTFFWTTHAVLQSRSPNHLLSGS